MSLAWCWNLRRRYGLPPIWERFGFDRNHGLDLFLVFYRELRHCFLWLVCRLAIRRMSATGCTTRGIWCRSGRLLPLLLLEQELWLAVLTERGKAIERGDRPDRRSHLEQPSWIMTCVNVIRSTQVVSSAASTFNVDFCEQIIKVKGIIQYYIIEL